MSELTLPYFLVTPAAPNGRGVVLIHEGYGMTSHILRFAEELGRQGYTVAAPDLFWRTGGPKDGPGGHLDGDYWSAIDAMTPEQLLDDLRTTIAALRAAGATSIGITGFCLGGNTSYTAARHADELGIGASVAFYGTSIAEDLGDLQCPTLLFFGDEDEFFSADAMAAVKARHADILHVYQGAGHAFMRDDMPTHRPVQAADAWTRLLAFFDEHLD